MGIFGQAKSIKEQINGVFTPMRPHPEQNRLVCSQSRYNVVPAGRRSGKTEIVGKRRLIYRALAGSRFPNPRYFVAAPTRDQAKRIYWDDLKKMTKPFWAQKPSESHLIIYLLTRSEIHVLGMDKPERVEGSPWDGGVLDEYGNMKEKAWKEHVRPSLSDRGGWVDFIGVPEGRNHYYDLYKKAQEDNKEALRKGKIPAWDTFHWISADILPSYEIAQAKNDLDELTYLQEYEASFVNFSGQAYYAFDEKRHCQRLQYDPYMDLIFCFDFNVTPGTAVVCQEQKLPNNTYGTGIIGEVYITRNSNTPRVCDRLIKDWGEHQGNIVCYGDYSGGNKGTAKILGSDWELIKQSLEKQFGGNRVDFDVPPNPRERERVNSVNSRLKSVNGTVRMMVDPSKAPWTVKDLEGVRVLEGGSGELDKEYDKKLSHLTDGLGYYVNLEFPTLSDEGDAFVKIGGH